MLDHAQQLKGEIIRLRRDPQEKKEAIWTGPPLDWGPAPLHLVEKTVQHMADHTQTLLCLAIYGDSAEAKPLRSR